MITPEATVDLLTYMWAHPDTAVAGAFIRSLPIGGVDGTIENLITEGPAVGNLRAKTGTMTGVRSLSGYVATSDGRPLVFSMISNHHTVPTTEVNRVQRKLVNLLASL
jgi:D-alanyl-D-alanine carboxypeptidase/D-alanyl-D-alanine-endopeptidase (penicillin-binding protein 4)